MALKDTLYKLRTDARMSQARFAEALQVSPQAVQKWESGMATPELEKIIQIAKHFGVSVDALVLERNTRTTEELAYNKRIQPRYANLHEWEFYGNAMSLKTEFAQCMDEGLDVARYEELFRQIMLMPDGEYKARMADVLFDLVMNAGMRSDYPYTEPSELSEIRKLCKPFGLKGEMPDEKTLEDKIHGAWLGRVCGCLLGRPIEGILSRELIPLLKQSGNDPMHRYVLSTDVTEEMRQNHRFDYTGRSFADVVDGMPPDDDTNYVVLAQEMVEKYGRNFTPYDVSRAWIDMQPKSAYCTAERVAFCNFIRGYEPPESAVYQNPYREWIGAQIRGDYFGYINPGDPETASEMAFRDASISHVKNGIYGEMFAAAMIACAAVTEDIKSIILGGLSQVPSTSRLYEAVMQTLEDYENGVTMEEFYIKLRAQWDEESTHALIHTISNAMIVTAALLNGGGEFGKSLCMAVQAGFDTDCNGATVGSIIGMRNGAGSVSGQWLEPVHDQLHTTIFGVGTVSIAERAQMTMKHLPKR